MDSVRDKGLRIQEQRLLALRDTGMGERPTLSEFSNSVGLRTPLKKQFWVVIRTIITQNQKIKLEAPIGKRWAVYWGEAQACAQRSATMVSKACGTAGSLCAVRRVFSNKIQVSRNT